MAATTREKIVAGMDALQLALAGIPGERAEEPGACGAWSVRELVHHVAYWEENEARELEGLLRGDPRPDHGEGEWWLAVNDEVAATWAGRSFQDARRELTDAHTRLLKALDGFAAGQEPDVSADTWEHFDEHRADIERWKVRTGLT